MISKRSAVDNRCASAPLSTTCLPSAHVNSCLSETSLTDNARSNTTLAMPKASSPGAFDRRLVFLEIRVDAES